MHCTDYTESDLQHIIDSQWAPFFIFLLDLRSNETNISCPRYHRKLCVVWSLNVCIITHSCTSLLTHYFGSWAFQNLGVNRISIRSINRPYANYLKTYPKARYHQILVKPYSKSSYIFQNPYRFSSSYLLYFCCFGKRAIAKCFKFYLGAEGWVRNYLIIRVNKSCCCCCCFCFCCCCCRTLYSDAGFSVPL